MSPQLHRQTAPGQQMIQSYGGGGFRIADVWYRGSVLILPDATRGWPVADLAEASLASLRPIIEALPRVELLLLGSGASFLPPPAALQTALREQSIALEAMATPAACRTFNVLLAEDRRVAAALIAV